MLQRLQVPLGLRKVPDSAPAGQGDCATLGNLRYFVKQSASLDLTSSNQHKDAAYGDSR